MDDDHVINMLIKLVQSKARFLVIIPFRNGGLIVVQSGPTRISSYLNLEAVSPNSSFYWDIKWSIISMTIKINLL